MTQQEAAASERTRTSERRCLLCRGSLGSRCALLAALLALLAMGGTWYGARWRAAQEESIYEAVFRYQMERLDAEFSPNPPKHYYLSYGLHPASGEFMRRFSDLGTKVQPGPGLTVIDGRDVAGWKAIQERTGGSSVQLFVGPWNDPMRWHGNAEVLVFGSWGRRTIQDDCRLYEVTRKHGRWAVTKDTSSG